VEEPNQPLDIKQPPSRHHQSQKNETIDNQTTKPSEPSDQARP
jgi:hypothetical protein